jgi:rRNA-processing protein FCF1
MYGRNSSDVNTQTNNNKPYIMFVIPWIVVQELDGLKSGHGGGGEIDLRGKAQRSIRYLQNELERSEETRRIRGQKLSEYLEEHNVSILQC